MKGLVAVSALLLSGCYQPPQSPPGKVEIVSLTCRNDSIRTWGEGVIRNSGETTLRFPKVFVLFDDGTVGDYIAQPMTVPPGSLATFGIVGPEGKHECEIFAVQDQQGRSLI